MSRATDRAALIAHLEAADAVVAPVNSVADILQDTHIVARGNVIEVDDPVLGPMRMQAPAGRMSRTPQAGRHTGASVGEHTREVLIGALGFSEDELRAAGLGGDWS